MGVLLIVIAIFLIVNLIPKPKNDGTGSVVPPDGQAQGTPLQAIVVETVGSVTIQRNGTVTAAVKDAELKTGDVIKTGNDGYASLEFYGGTRTGIDTNSELVIVETSVDPANWKKQRTRLRLEVGRVWSRALQLLDPQSVYDVDYRGVVSTVRGTAFLVTGTNLNSGETFTLDAFDGTVRLSGKTTGSIGAGFSVSFDPMSPPPVLKSALHFTADDIRNDYWVHAELARDADFARRGAELRKERGVNEPITGIGDEAGPFTIKPNGSGHTNFRAVLIEASTTTERGIRAGSRVPLTALAVFDDGRVQHTQVVTTEAAWQVSDPTIATIDDNGFLTVDLKVTGTISVIARWNDGTHEHSGTRSFRILPRS